MGLKLKFYFIFFLFLSTVPDTLFSQQLNLPLNQDFMLRYEAKLNSGDSLVYHSGCKPLIENQVIRYDDFQQEYKTRVTKHFAWLFSDKNWIKRKSKWENLFQAKGDEFYFDVNPVFNFEYGRDLANDNSQKYYKNTRGFIVNAHVTDKVSFSTTFYENQMYVPTYLRNYATSIGSSVYYNNSWRFEDAVMPGQGRVKPFKTKGYDFAYATGYVSYSPVRNINLQFGNGKLFVGEGYRSVLLSDNAFNYPYFRFTGNFFKGKIQYNTTFASLTNLRRLQYHTTPEAQYERKAATFTYVSASVSKKLQIGIFEGTVFRRTENNQQTKPVDPFMFNPLIGVNTVRGIFDQDNMNVLVGLNAKYLLGKKIYAYGQLAIDDPRKNKYGWQLGAKWFDAFHAKDLFLQVELNQSSARTYAANDNRINYTQYNQPLAFTPGGGTFEAIAKAYYRSDDFFYEYQFNYQTYRYYETGYQWGKDPFITDQFAVDPIVKNSMAQVFYHDVKFGYVVNPLYNMQLLIGWFHRGISNIDNPYRTSYLYIGFRTSLSNFYYDI